MHAAEREADAFVLQEPAHSAGGFESERAAAGKHHRVDMIGDV